MSEWLSLQGRGDMLERKGPERAGRAGRKGGDTSMAGGVIAGG